MVRHIQSVYEFKEKPTRYIINGAHLASATVAWPDGRPCVLLYVPLNGFCEFIATLINPLEASSISILILDEFSLKVMPLCPGVNEEHAEDGGPEL